MSPAGSPVVPSPSTAWSQAVAFTQRIDEPTDKSASPSSDVRAADSAAAPSAAELRRQLLKMIVANEKLRRQDQQQTAR